MSDCNGHANANGDRLPPQNLEAERGALGAVLIDPPRMAEVRPILGPDDPYRADHQRIYRAMRTLDDEGLPCDPILVSNRLAAGGMDPTAADELVAEMMGAVPSVDSAAHYAGVVREKSLRRAIIEVSRVLEREAYCDDHNAATLLRRHVARIERLAPPPAVEPDRPEAVASLADIKRVISDEPWLWPDWLVAAHMTVLAAEPGVGKTRLALDLCRRLWGALPWPDGELATRPPGTASLWVATDRNFPQIAKVSALYGLPDEAVYFNAPPEDPCGGLNLDNPAAVSGLARRIRSARPGIVVIDTINRATRRPLYRPEEAEAFFGPLVDLARELRFALLALTHLSRSGDPIDRRIEGACRVMWKLECPDPTDRGRLRLSAPKTEDEHPAPLGVTMRAEGNEYDNSPPAPPEDKAAAQAGGKAGRPPKALAAAIDWLRDHLSNGPAYCKPTIDAAEESGHSKPTFWRAVRALGVLTDGPKGNQFFRLDQERADDPDPEDDGEDTERFT